MEITVTQEDIDTGVANSCVACPIALAINRTFHPYPTARIANGLIQFGFYNEQADKTERVDVEYPESVTDFILSL